MRATLHKTKHDYIITIDDEIRDGRTNFFTYDNLNDNVLHIDYIKYFGNDNDGKGNPANGRASFRTYNGTSSGISHKEVIAANMFTGLPKIDFSKLSKEECEEIDYFDIRSELDNISKIPFDDTDLEVQKFR